MKDILFLVPLYYTSNSVVRTQNYIREATGNFTYDIYFCCTTPSIFEESKLKCESNSFIDQRENVGVGQGMLWHLKHKRKTDLSAYKYIWFFEESCEPIRPDWIEKALAKLNSGWKICGWDWHYEGKKRNDQIPHVFKGDNGNTCIALKNTKATALDSAGNSVEAIWDTPGYRHESIVFHSEDFQNFEFSDPYHSIWMEKGGTYGTSAERFWWDLDQKNIHGYPLPSPNLQWEVIKKYKFVPPAQNDFFWYYRELGMEKKYPNYIPASFFVRKLIAIKSHIKMKKNLFFKRIYKISFKISSKLNMFFGRT